MQLPKPQLQPALPVQKTSGRFFRNFNAGRPSRLVLREGHPVLRGGEVQRQLPQGVAEMLKSKDSRPQSMLWSIGMPQDLHSSVDSTEKKISLQQKAMEVSRLHNSVFNVRPRPPLMTLSVGQLPSASNPAPQGVKTAEEGKRLSLVEQQSMFDLNSGGTISLAQKPSTANVHVPNPYLGHGVNQTSNCSAKGIRVKKFRNSLSQGLNGSNAHSSFASTNSSVARAAKRNSQQASSSTAKESAVPLRQAQLNLARSSVDFLKHRRLVLKSFSSNTSPTSILVQGAKASRIVQGQIKSLHILPY